MKKPKVYCLRCGKKTFEEYDINHCSCGFCWTLVYGGLDRWDEKVSTDEFPVVNTPIGTLAVFNGDPLP